VLREQKTASAPCGGSEKSSLQAVKDLAKPLTEEKIAKSTPTHHEHEAKWEIPVQSRALRFSVVLAGFVVERTTQRNGH